MISEKKQKIYIGIFCSIAIIIMIFLGVRNNISGKKERDKYGKYTVGILTGWNIPVKQSAIVIYYKYSISSAIDNVYENKPYYMPSSFNIHDINTEGGKYIVKFSSKDPDNAELLLELGEVPDTIAYPLYFSSCDTLPKW